MTQTRWLSDDEQAMWRSYLLQRREIDLAIEAQLRTHGLSTADFSLLVPLSEAPEPLRARDLGAATGWESSRIAHQLRRMEQRGLITRVGCPSDGRGTLIALSARGREVIEAAAPGHVEVVRAAFVDQLSEDEKAVLATVFARLTDGATAGVGGMPPSA